ncbi:ABC transporter substrate-binding protein [Chitinimonas sp. BJYL2]|uniref:substrate-binding periplasmic protein n=1 Tax=Chitinimonas sp. BJYL2 TaxID=2976696 RepID=UPI0022B4223B|nr:transporter substrate-binding domain-containing protein [Chitinimonas sp. BJYL2]
MEYMRTFLHACLLLMIALAPWSVRAAPLRVSASSGWGMPIGEVDAQGHLSGGIMHELYGALGREMNVPVVVLTLPRKRIDNAVMHGEVDLRCFLNRRWVGNPADYRWSGTLFTVQDVVVARADTPSPANLAELRGKTLGTVLGYVYPDALQVQLGKQIVREDAPTPALALSKLLLGRSDYALVDSLVLAWYAKHQRVRFAANPLVVNSYEIECATPIRTGQPGQAALAALERMRKRGDIAQILARYQSAH